MATEGGPGPPQLLRRPRQPRGSQVLHLRAEAAMDDGAQASQPEDADDVAEVQPAGRRLAAQRPQYASLPRPTLCRHSREVGAQCGSSARWDLCGGRGRNPRPYRDHLSAAGAQVSVLAHGRRTDQVAEDGLVARDLVSGSET